MYTARRFLAQRNFAVLLCAATLVLKLLVPAGYMIGGEHGRVSIELCSGVASPEMAMAMPGMQADMPGHGKSKEHGKAEAPCAFSGLSTASLAAVDTVQLATLIAFVMAFGALPIVLPRVIRQTHLRPPLRGPPTHL